MSCCSSSSITPCTISVNDALSLLDCTCNSCGSLCESSVATQMPPSPIPQFAALIQVEDYLVPEGTFGILNFEASGASFSTVTDNGGGRCTINVDTQLVERRTRVDALNDIGNSDLIPGKLYWIYDVGDAVLDPPANASLAYAGIILRALDVDRLDTTGAYIARTPNRILTSYWYNGGSYAQNSFVEHFNCIYTNASGPASLSATPPSADPAVWTRIPKNNSKYDTYVFSCVYDIKEDQIYKMTDMANNTVSVTKQSGTSINELFLYCFRWGASNVYFGNTLTVNNLSNAYAGFLPGTTYPIIAQTGTNRVNLNFSSYTFSGNNITVDLGKGSVGFNSVEYVAGAPFYCSFYGDPALITPPSFTNNTVENCYTFINEYVEIDNNNFYNCEVGTQTGTIFDSSFSISLYGQVLSSTFTRCRIRNNTGAITASNLSDSAIYANTDVFLTELNGLLEVGSNENCTIQKVNGLNRNVSSTFFGENKINNNSNIFVRDISGDRFTINLNENISIYDNIRLYNGNIARNTAPVAPILLDTKGTSVITVADPRLSCCIIQCELDNFATISDCVWETAGAISRVKLSRAEIKFLTIDFRDPVWAGSGVGPTNPPASSDMLIDTVNVYLFQNRNKLNNYDAPAIFNGLTATASTDIDGVPLPSGGDTLFAALNAYTYDSVGNKYDNISTISSETPYATGAVLSNSGSDAYVFLNTENTNIYNGATDTLRIPAWAQHATVIYLYNKAPFTCDIGKIEDVATAVRPNFKLRLVPLSDGMVINLNTVSTATATTNEIVSSLTPGPAAVGIADKFDILELEKRGDIYYVSNYQKML